MYHFNQNKQEYFHLNGFDDVLLRLTNAIGEFQEEGEREEEELITEVYLLHVEIFRAPNCVCVPRSIVCRSEWNVV